MTFFPNLWNYDYKSFCHVCVCSCVISLLSDQSVLASAALSATDSVDSSTALTRQVDLLERRNAELEQKLLNESQFCCFSTFELTLW